MIPKKLSLAYSTCPNDTYIFDALAHNRLDESPFDFSITLADVETLNQKAHLGIFDVTKLSFAALGHVLDGYTLLRTGAALGRGCGPLVITRPGRSMENTPRPRIAVPGFGTTAYLLCRFFLNDMFPNIEPEFTALPFEKIMPAVTGGQADFGVIIHEGRFVYKTLDLTSLADLGAWWEKKTGMPIPLGCIAVKRGLGPESAAQVEALICQSIDFAHKNPEIAMPYIKAHAQELEDHVIQEHIRLYVNNFSRDIGREGEIAIRTFLAKGIDAGLIPQPKLPLFPG